MAKLWQFLQGHPKPEFSKKVKRGDQGKFFKNRKKSSPRLKGLKAIWRKWHYLPISMHLKCKDWKRFWRKKRLQRVPEWPSYGNFREVIQNPHFLKKCKGGPREIFQKSAKKMPTFERPKSTLAQITLSFYLVCTWSAKTAKDFGAKNGSKSSRMAKLWQFWQGHPKEPFSKKVQRGDQGKFFKNRPKSGPPFKNPTALWRKWHYPVNSMHL